MLLLFSQETTKKSTETRIVETLARPGTSQSNKYKSTNSLHELGLDNYPNPDYPESSRLSRKEEKQSLQNLNNRLAGYIDRVRQLQNENAKLTHQVMKLNTTCVILISRNLSLSRSRPLKSTRPRR